MTPPERYTREGEEPENDHMRCPRCNGEVLFHPDGGWSETHTVECMTSNEE